MAVTKIQTGWLLDAVRHVKAQKQRPDKDRICHYIQQRHDVTTHTVSMLLDSAVRENILTTTITRGNTDKLTYVITSPDAPGALTNKPKPSASSSSQSAAKPKTSASTAVEVRPTSDNDNKKVVLHNKSDISLFMVKAVKGSYNSYPLPVVLQFKLDAKLWKCICCNLDIASSQPGTAEVTEWWL